MLVRNVALKIGERAFVYCKILVAVHVVDVKIHAVDRNIRAVVAVDHAVNRFGVVIAPAALLKAECPERRNIAFPDCRAELSHYFARAVGSDQIDVKIHAANCDFRLVRFAVADVPADTRREVDEYSKA